MSQFLVMKTGWSSGVSVFNWEKKVGVLVSLPGVLVSGRFLNKYLLEF